MAEAAVYYQHHGDNGRYGVFRAAIDIHDYFVSLGIPIGILAPLRAVSAAIVDADKGKESAVFKPDRSRKGGRPPKRAEDLIFEAHLAVVTECCIRHCQQVGQQAGERSYVDEGCGMASDMIRSSKLKHIISSKQLKKLRERVGYSEKDEVDRAAYDELMSSAFATADPLNWAKTLLDHDWVNRPPSENPSNPPD